MCGAAGRRNSSLISDALGPLSLIVLVLGCCTQLCFIDSNSLGKSGGRATGGMSAKFRLENGGVRVILDTRHNSPSLGAVADQWRGDCG